MLAALCLCGLWFFTSQAESIAIISLVALGGGGGQYPRNSQENAAEGKEKGIIKLLRSLWVYIFIGVGSQTI